MNRIVHYDVSARGWKIPKLFEDFPPENIPEHLIFTPRDKYIEPIKPEIPEKSETPEKPQNPYDKNEVKKLKEELYACQCREAEMMVAYLELMAQHDELKKVFKKINEM